jgi:hypothetical protein
MPDLGQQYVSLHSSNCETWASTVSNPVSSTVSSPSSAANTDDYSTAYIPTSVHSSMMPSHSSSSTTSGTSHSHRNSSSNTAASHHHLHHHTMGKEVKMESYDDVDGSGMHSLPLPRTGLYSILYDSLARALKES